MKVFALPPNEQWICDEQVACWRQGNDDITTLDPYEADIIWLMAGWCWRQLPIELLRTKTVVTTVHHIVHSKFDAAAKADFYALDEVTDTYHVPNHFTQEHVQLLTDKPVHLIPYWADQHTWFRSNESKESIRKRLGIPVDAFVVMSAQRDTEGHDLKTGKWEKGPDLFVEVCQQLHRGYGRHVLLGGHRRQYVMTGLEKAGIPYTYIEMADQQTLRDMYQCADLYVVSSRFEGGPQSLIEAGLMVLACVSRDIGMASQVLPPSALYNMNVMMSVPAVPHIEHLKLPQGFAAYRRLFEELKAK